MRRFVAGIFTFEEPENESLALLNDGDRLSIHRAATLLAQANRSTISNFFQKLPFAMQLKIIAQSAEKLSEKDAECLASQEYEYVQKMHENYQSKQFSQ